MIELEPLDVSYALTLAHADGDVFEWCDAERNIVLAKQCRYDGQLFGYFTLSLIGSSYFIDSHKDKKSRISFRYTLLVFNHIINYLSSEKLCDNIYTAYRIGDKVEIWCRYLKFQELYKLRGFMICRRTICQ